MTWDYPAAQALSTTVLKSVSDSLTINHATVNEDSKSTTPPIRACYRTDLGPATPCDETTVITSVIDTDDNAFPSYFNLDVDTITVNADSNTQSRLYTMIVVHSTVDTGDITFNTVEITVGDCVIEDILLPNDPSPVSYTIHALNNVVLDLSTPGFQQFPACGYVLGEIFGWSFDPSIAPPISTDVGSDPYAMTVSSTDNSDHGIYAATLTNQVTYDTQSWVR